MVSKTVIMAFAVKCILCIVPFVFLRRCLRQESKTNHRAFFTGVFSFGVFSLLLEQLCHTLVFTNFSVINNNLWLYTIYGALAAGVFEELGKFTSAKLLIKDEITYNTAISFGMGYGFVETFIMGVMPSINSMMGAMSINKGVFESTYGLNMPAETIQKVKDEYMSLSEGMIYLSAYERILVFIIQVALCVLIVYGIKSNKFRFILLSLGLHVLVDLFAVFYQKTGFSVYFVYIYLTVFALFAIKFIFKSKNLFENVNTN